MVAAAPGLRIPGTTDRNELAFQVLISQQISMAAAVTCAAKLTGRYGEELAQRRFGLAGSSRPRPRWPTADPTELPMPRARGRALVRLAQALARGEVDLDGARPLAEHRRRCSPCPGSDRGPPTTIAMRGLGRPATSC